MLFLFGFWTLISVIQVVAQTISPLPDVSFTLWDGISRVGFPAVAFVLMWILVRTTLRDNSMAIRELSDLVRDLRAFIRGEGKQ